MPVSTEMVATVMAWMMMALPVYAQTPGVTAFVGVSVVPMDRERVLAGQTVLVRGGHIAAIGPVGRVKVPANAARVDGRGKFLIPGLADMHIHIWSDVQPPQQGQYVLFPFLAHGVTTVRDMGSSLPIMLELRDRVAKGELIGPRIYVARTQLEAAEITTPAMAKEIVAKDKADGYDFIKIHSGPQSDEVFDTLVAAARRAGIPIAGHSTVNLAAMLRGHVASIEHMNGYYDALLDSTRPKAELDSLENSGIEGFVKAHDLSKAPRLAAATKQAGVWNCPTGMWSGLANPVRYKLVKALHDVGAGLLLGTDRDFSDRPWPQVAELTEFVKSGLTPYQALETGTRNAAIFLGALDSAGTIAVGKRADLVLLTSNPLKDVNAVADPAGTMVGGHWLSREDFSKAPPR